VQVEQRASLGATAVAALALLPVAALALAELAAVTVSPFAGALAYGLVIGLLVLPAGMQSERFPLLQSSSGEPRLVEMLLLSFVTVSIVRLLSLSVPVESIPRIWWFAGAGVPGLLAVVMLARAAGLTPNDLGLAGPPSLSQLGVALTGLPLGYLGYAWVEPTALLDEPDIFKIVAFCLVLALFSAALEELLFRGAMQPVTARIFGPYYGVLYSALVFTLVYIGSRSPEALLLAFLTGVLFGLARQRTGALWGVIVAHALMTCGMLVVYPVYL
jgi:hypothetical protein